jgi:predicted nucleotidyltransferase component of viral defense system
MISFGEIERLSLRYAVPQETIEKDYVLSWVLTGLSTLNLTDDLVFRGGTAIKKIFLPNHRFSYDLDFISTGIKGPMMIERLDKVIDWLKGEANLLCAIKDRNPRIVKSRLRIPLTYDGFTQITIAKEVLIDLAHRAEAELLTPLIEGRIISEYTDLQPRSSALTAYRPEAIAAEKVGAIFDHAREEPRDIYDLWALLGSRRIDGRTLAADFERAYGYAIPHAALVEEMKRPTYEKLWEIRLKDQVPNLPPIERIVSEIDELLKGL